MTRPLVVLHPGTVRSINDGDIHHVPADRLVRLYGLRPGEYILERPGWEFCLPKNVLHLWPRSDGDYRRPRELDETP